MRTSIFMCSAGGSSPLTRGKPGRAGDRVRDLRLIPAHAGKTGSVRTEVHPRAAHPRSCGENLCTLRQRVVI